MKRTFLISLLCSKFQWAKPLFCSSISLVVSMFLVFSIFCRYRSRKFVAIFICNEILCRFWLFFFGIMHEQWIHHNFCQLFNSKNLLQFQIVISTHRSNNNCVWCSKSHPNIQTIYYGHLRGSKYLYSINKQNTSSTASYQIVYRPRQLYVIPILKSSIFKSITQSRKNNKWIFIFHIFQSNKNQSDCAEFWWIIEQKNVVRWFSVKAMSVKLHPNTNQWKKQRQNDFEQRISTSKQSERRKRKRKKTRLKQR